VDHLASLLQADARRRIENAQAKLRQAAASLEALSPVAILGRGYSITRLESSDEIVREAAQAKPGDRIVTRLGSGRLVSRVERDDGAAS
jgi:exodeoxyribonuclease VII large subunit